MLSQPWIFLMLDSQNTRIDELWIRADERNNLTKQDLLQQTNAPRRLVIRPMQDKRILTPNC